MSTSDTTVWQVSVNAATSGQPTATLTVSLNGGSFIPTQLKGVCYSPAPLNGSNHYAPAIGDWFWDSFSGQGYSIQGWDALWQRDLPCIRALGANTIRVYSMISRQINSDGTFPNPWSSGQLFTHQNFLDACWNQNQNPIYVLVGIPLPASIFWENEYNPNSPETAFWYGVVAETAAQLAHHPAVLGFILENEQDGADVCYNNSEWATFWWGQVEKIANTVKTAAPHKLVGIANHDDPNIPGKAASYMANCPHVDFWGVNSYQTSNFNAVFSQSNDGPGYNGLTNEALKPVILTEYGLPVTGHQKPNDLSTIYEDAATRQNTANVIASMLPQAFAEPLCLGLYYFEYCDEWWNEPEAPNIYTWWGGDEDDGLPNHFWDQDGFGLYSIARGAGLNDNDPIWTQNGGYGKPNTPIDTHTERVELTTVVKQAFNKIK